MAANLAPVPPSLRPIGHYINIAKENASRDPVVHYWCLFYAVQTGMTLDKESKEALKYLTSLLSILETIKKQLAGEEAISQEMVAQAHIENFAMKLFEYADKNDRQSNFSKSVVKAFYTAGYLIDVLTLFGELEDNLVVTRKYAKWKAAYIGNCLKKGETPVPGSAGGQVQDEFNLDVPSLPKPAEVNEPSSASLPGGSGSTETNALTEPQERPIAPARNISSLPPPKTGDGHLTMEDFLEAQKYCKYAVSALSYEDATSAMENIEKAMAILKTH